MTEQSIPEDVVRSFLSKVQRVGEDLPKGRQFAVPLDDELLRLVEHPIQLLGPLREFCSEYGVESLGAYVKHFIFRKR